jgi:DNA-binding NtrC family response regulator
MSEQKILIAEDDDQFAHMLEIALKHLGYEILLATDGCEALERVENNSPDLIITDLRMPCMDGLQLLRQLREKRLDIPVVVVTAHKEIEPAIEAMKAGAVDYILKPVDLEQIRLVIQKALELRQILAENVHLRREAQRRYDFGSIIAHSEGMKQAIQMAEQVAPSNATVLIVGESGTGKELLARAIHLNSPRSRRPFIAINCAALPENLLESELFGYEKGAFTGAAERKKGRFELADGGTILLDEISRMALPLQAKILRVVQEKEFDRLGGTKTIHADVRILVATNQDLKALIRDGRFLEDLYYRVSVFPITIPPLRERRNDIVPLAKFFLARFCAEMGKKVPEIAPDAERTLLNYPWSGNVREVQNYIERAVILLRGETLTPDLLPEALVFRPAGEKKALSDVAFRLPEEGIALEDLERSLLVQAIERSEGNKTAAAKLLGLTRATLRYRLEKHGLIETRSESEETLE